MQPDAFLRACRRQPTEITPVWLMRQAGRYQKEYREIRAKNTFLELCKNPELAAEVTVHAVRQLGVDAAIIFADILLILEPMGLPISFGKGDGPQIGTPVRSREDIDRLQVDIDCTNSLDFVLKAIGRVRKEIPDTPLIGFAGAPFTLASYMIEGGGSKHYITTKTMMYSDPGAFSALMSRISQATLTYLLAQITAGAQAIQLFDSWVGAISPFDYREHVLPHMKTIVQGLPKDIPVISFGTGTATLLEMLAESGVSVVGIDWRVPMTEARKRLPDVALQGNLDPIVLFAPIPEIRKRVQRIMAEMKGHPGFIFNLGHGILPETPVEHVQALVQAVHEFTEQ
jgi:uroporphyrinogen decarboxylase